MITLPGLVVVHSVNVSSTATLCTGVMPEVCTCVCACVCGCVHAFVLVLGNISIVIAINLLISLVS